MPVDTVILNVPSTADNNSQITLPHNNRLLTKKYMELRKPCENFWVSQIGSSKYMYHLAYYRSHNREVLTAIQCCACWLMFWFCESDVVGWFWCPQNCLKSSSTTVRPKTDTKQKQYLLRRSDNCTSVNGIIELFLLLIIWRKSRYIGITVVRVSI